MEQVTHLQIEPTTRCNFTCGFCCGRKMTQTDLKFEDFEKALEALKDLRQLELQGEGEPLMHPRFFDMVSLARKKNIAVSFITNGSLLSEEAVEKIVALGVEKISVSLESADPASFRDIRGGKLEKVISGIERLMALRKARGSDRPVVGFSVTVLRRTKDDLRGILELYRRLGLDGGITMQPLQQMPAYTQSYDADMLEQLLSRDEVDRVWIDYRADPEVRKIQKERRSDLGFHDHLMAGWQPSQKNCPWLERGLYVDRTGLATGCCMMKQEETAFGRIGLDSFDQLLAGRKKLRDELATGRIPQPCSGCELARFAVTTKLGLVRFALAGAKTRLKVLLGS